MKRTGTLWIGQNFEQTKGPTLFLLTEWWRKRWWQFNHQTTVWALQHSWETSLTDDTSSKTAPVCVCVIFNIWTESALVQRIYYFVSSCMKDRTGWDRVGRDGVGRGGAGREGKGREGKACPLLMRLFRYVQRLKVKLQPHRWIGHLHCWSVSKQDTGRPASNCCNEHFLHVCKYFRISTQVYLHTLLVGFMVDQSSEQHNEQQLIMTTSASGLPTSSSNRNCCWGWNFSLIPPLGQHLFVWFTVSLIQAGRLEIWLSRKMRIFMHSVWILII